MTLSFPQALIALALLFSLDSHAITIVHSNDVVGEIEPCGCRNNPQGGMARKANLLARQKDRELIQLDAGDLLFSSEKIPDLLQKQSELQAAYLLKAHDLLHHDAVVPGEKDFALGLKTFEKLVSKTKIAFIAANLRKKGGESFLPPYVVLKRKTPDGKIVRIAILGLVDENLNWPKGLHALPAIETAKKEVPALRKKADLLIALTHLGQKKDEELAHAVPGIDLIVGAHSQSFLQEPVRIAHTTVYQSSFRNQYVGLIHVYPEQDYEMVGLDAGYDSPADSPNAVDRLVKEFKAKVSELSSQQDSALQKLAETPESRRKTIQTFVTCAGCHTRQFEFWRKTRHALALEPLLVKDQASNKECLGCHTVGLGAPGGFSDVKILAELKAEEKAEAERWGAPELSAFLRAVHEAKGWESSGHFTKKDTQETLAQAVAKFQKSWAPVQCENCHGPAHNHPFTGEYKKAVSNSTCLECHTYERAPEWYGPDKKPDAKLIEAKRALVTCPAGDQP